MTATTEERLAALQARRTSTAATPGAAPTGGASPPTTGRSRRRSPARASKVLAVGMTTTAVLGTMAAIALAERDDESALPSADRPPDAPPESTAPAKPVTVESMPATTETPPTAGELVVVVLDAAGTPLATSTFATGGPPVAVVTLDFLATDDSSTTLPPRVELQEIPVPTTVDLAVPPAPPSAAPAAPAAPTPQPEATSSGS